MLAVCSVASVGQLNIIRIPTNDTISALSNVAIGHKIYLLTKFDRYFMINASSKDWCA